MDTLLSNAHHLSAVTHAVSLFQNYPFVAFCDFWVLERLTRNGIIGGVLPVTIASTFSATAHIYCLSHLSSDNELSRSIHRPRGLVFIISHIKILRNG